MVVSVKTVLVTVIEMIVVANASVVAVIDDIDVTMVPAVVVTHGFGVSIQEQAVLIKPPADAESLVNKLA